MDTKVEITDSNITIMTLQGDVLDAGNSKEFRRVASPILDRSKKVVFDLSGLQFVDSSGLGAILSCLRQLNASGGNLRLCGMTKPVKALFELVRMHRLFDIFDTKEE